jgi:hypothetical protein
LNPPYQKISDGFWLLSSPVDIVLGLLPTLLSGYGKLSSFSLLPEIYALLAALSSSITPSMLAPTRPYPVLGRTSANQSKDPLGLDTLKSCCELLGDCISSEDESSNFRVQCHDRNLNITSESTNPLPVELEINPLDAGTDSGRLTPGFYLRNTCIHIVHWKVNVLKRTWVCTTIIFH